MDEFREHFNSGDESGFIKDVFHGVITVNSLFKPGSKKLYNATVKQLLQGVNTAFKFDDEVSKALFIELSDNIYIFSAAKTYQEVRELSSFILDGKKLRPFAQFEKIAMQTLNDYNSIYLAAEYNTAIGQAQTAVKWQQIQRQAKTLPYLQRQAVMDANTSPECVVLNKITAAVGDPFWRTRSPLTHFDCRCILVQLDKYDDVVLSSPAEIEKAMKETDHINPLFKGNPGIDKVIFNDTHPYFDIAPKDKSLAKRNFNLPIPKKNV